MNETYKNLTGLFRFSHIGRQYHDDEVYRTNELLNSVFHIKKNYNTVGHLQIYGFLRNHFQYDHHSHYFSRVYCL